MGKEEVEKGEGGGSVGEEDVGVVSDVVVKEVMVLIVESITQAIGEITL